MTTSVVSAPNVRLGAQRPQVEWLPADRFDGGSGDEAIELCTAAGMRFDEWQDYALRSILWENERGKWSAFEAALIIARQNGKGEVLMGRELFALFVANDPLTIHSAHEFKTAEEAFKRIRDVIRDSDTLSRKVRTMPESHGDEGVELLPIPTLIMGAGSRMVKRKITPRLRFVARTSGGGRGFTANTVVWDEAFNLPQTVVGAQMPMLSAVPNPQIIYASSAVDRTIHSHGQALSKLRARALAGNEPRVCWLGWQGDEERYVRMLAANDRRGLREFVREVEQWYAANPAMTTDPLVAGRLSEEHTDDERRGMSVRTFATERLNIGDWFDVEDDDGVIDMERWAAIGDPASRPVGKIALAVDVSPDRKWACIASGGYRSDGRMHVKIVDHRPGTHWIADRIADLVGAYAVPVVVLDPAGPVGALIEPLHAAGIRDRKADGTGKLLRVTAQQHAQACGALVDDIAEDADRVRHCAQDNLDDALRDAATRPLGDAWAWARGRSGGDITPVVAVTLAAHGARGYVATTGVLPWASRG